MAHRPSRDDNTAMSTAPTITETSSNVDETTSIMFFDGVCGMCNASVDFAMPRDKHHQLRFAPLQGETAARLLDERDRQLDTVVLQTPNGTYVRSAAVVRLLWTLGGVWKFLGTLLWLIPKPLRDLGYRTVAALRYRIYGQRDTCRLPTPEEVGRILP